MNQSDYLQLRELRDLQERMNRFFEDARGREAARDEEEWAQGVDWTPPVDIYEGDGQIILKMDLPEVEQKGIDIRVDGDRLLISGERRMDEAVKRENCYRIERRYGRYARSFTLPEAVDRDRIEASYRDGVLRLVLPRSVEKRARTISVKVK